MDPSPEAKPPGLLIGYARVSTEDQDLSLQLDALVKAGVSEGRIYREHASGASEDRPAFIAAVKALRAGDTLVVWKIDRLGRRLGRLIQTVEHIKAKGAMVRVLTEPFDTDEWGAHMGRIEAADGVQDVGAGTLAQMPLSDVNNLDEVVELLGIADDFTTPGEAVRALLAERDTLLEAVENIAARADRDRGAGWCRGRALTALEAIGRKPVDAE